jgi:hypothetical protein
MGSIACESARAVMRCDAMACRSMGLNGFDGDANNRKEREEGMGAAHESCRQARFLVLLRAWGGLEKSGKALGSEAGRWAAGGQARRGWLEWTRESSKTEPFSGREWEVGGVKEQQSLAGSHLDLHTAPAHAHESTCNLSSDRPTATVLALYRRYLLGRHGRLDPNLTSPRLVAPTSHCSPPTADLDMDSAAWSRQGTIVCRYIH